MVRSMGGVYCNPINRKNYLHVGSFACQEMLVPLSYPDVEIHMAKSLDIYTKVADSLQGHIEQCIQNFKVQEVPSGIVESATWRTYFESLLEASEEEIQEQMDNGELDWATDLELELLVFPIIAEILAEMSELTDTDEQMFCIGNYLQAIPDSDYEYRVKVDNYLPEFATKVVTLVFETLNRREFFVKSLV